MLQIIGWFGCFYLIIKSMEIGGRKDSFDEHGNMEVMPLMTILAAVLGAGIFAFLFWQQGQPHGERLTGDVPALEIPTTQESDDAFIACMEKAKTVDEVVAC